MADEVMELSCDHCGRTKSIDSHGSMIGEACHHCGIGYWRVRPVAFPPRPARDGETLSDERVADFLANADVMLHSECGQFASEAIRVVATLRTEVAAKDRRIAQLLVEDPACESCDEYERLTGQLGSLLTRTADALKGEPEPDSLHSWHDLPECATALRAQLAEAGKQRDMMLRKADELLCENILLRDLVHEVAVSGVESDLSPRYLTVQIDCETWRELQATRAARSGSARGATQ